MTDHSQSLLERLRAHGAEGYLSLHMPGHKENTALAPYLSALGAGMDITELPTFDDLHAPEGILAEGMERAGALWGSEKSLFQVNGSSGGLLAAIRGATQRGDRVLVARNCHKSIYHGLELCGLEPVFLVPPTVPEFGIAGSLSPEQVAAELDRYPDCKLVIYPSPTYDGVMSDTAGICAVAHSRGVPVLVDEAHGAHLGFSPDFPQSAVQGGADLVVASLHKMLPSLTQTAILHINGSLVDVNQVIRQAGIFQSSSPSYLLMASMDGCVRLLEERGPALFAQWSRRLAAFDSLAAGLRHLRLLGHGREAGARYENIFALDPAKIVISTRRSALSGVSLMEALREESHIELEMALEDYATAMTGLGTDDAMPRRLAEALQTLDDRYGPASTPPAEASALPPLPRRGLSIEAAVRSPGELVPLEKSVGRVSGAYLWAYPPGIPLITPGEVLSGELADTLLRLRQAGVKLVGTGGEPPRTVLVLKEGGSA